MDCKPSFKAIVVAIVLAYIMAMASIVVSDEELPGWPPGSVVAFRDRRQSDSLTSGLPVYVAYGHSEVKMGFHAVLNNHGERDVWMAHYPLVGGKVGQTKIRESYITKVPSMGPIPLVGYPFLLIRAFLSDWRMVAASSVAILIARLVLERHPTTPENSATKFKLS